MKTYALQITLESNALIGSGEGYGAIIDADVAGEHSLRTIRTIKKGITFKGEIYCQTENRNSERLLALACRNLRYMGTKRNRGFGKIKCELLGLNVDSILKEMEALCKN